MLKFKNKVVFSDNKHGWPYEQAPKAHVRANYFWGTKGESHIVGGQSSRPLIVNGVIGNSSYTTQASFSNGKRELDRLVGTIGDMQVTFADGSTRTYRNLYLALIQEIPQPGQKNPVPLPDLIGGNVGPAGGGYWLEVNLHFIEVKV